MTIEEYHKARDFYFQIQRLQEALKILTERGQADDYIDLITKTFEKLKLSKENKPFIDKYSAKLAADLINYITADLSQTEEQFKKI